MKRPAMLQLVGDATRFVLAGALNTLLSIFVYQALLFVLSPSWSYALAWVAGMAFAAAVYPDLVFPGGRHAMTDRVLLVASYACVFLAGLILLRFFVVLTDAPRIAILATLACTTAVGFLLSRLILRRGTQ
jgi:putative flippase GtrA